MSKRIHLLQIVFVGLFFSGMTAFSQINESDTLRLAEEIHFRNVRQLTFGGDNAEAYWSYDGKSVVFQRTSMKDGIPCDQIFYGKLPRKKNQPFKYKLLSTGKGRTTCPFFTKDDQYIIYASTHLGSVDCPPVPDRAKYGNKYIWPLYPSYDIFMADLTGKIVKQLTNSPYYDAEATLSSDGKKMIYTSTKDGDIELYSMDLKTGKEKRITQTLGYDGGAWFSPDGTKIQIQSAMLSKDNRTLNICIVKVPKAWLKRK